MIKEKTMDIYQLSDEIKNLKNNSSIIVLCHGVFDLIHLGHIKYFQEAKSYGDVLIVTVTPDEYVRRGPSRPVFTAEQRAEAIAALEVVDYVAGNQWPTAIKTIELIKPENHQQLLDDLCDRTGLNIHRFEIGRVDFMRDTARIRIFYFDDGANYSSLENESER